MLGYKKKERGFMTQKIANLIKVLESQERTGIIAPGTKDKLMETLAHLVRLEEEKAFGGKSC